MCGSHSWGPVALIAQVCLSVLISLRLRSGYGGYSLGVDVPPHFAFLNASATEVVDGDGPDV